MRTLIFILFIPLIGLSQSNDYVFFENNLNYPNLYCISLDTISETDLNSILEPSKRNFEPSEWTHNFRFWIVRNNRVAEYFEFLDTNDFDFQTIKKISIPSQYDKATILYSKKDSFLDSLRNTKTPFYFSNPSPDRSWMVDVECYFKPEEFSPWNDPEMMFWLSENKDSLMLLINESYSELDLESIDFTAASGPYRKGCHLKLRFFLSQKYWRMAPLMDIGFYPFNEVNVVERQYNITIGAKRK